MRTKAVLWVGGSRGVKYEGFVHKVLDKIWGHNPPLKLIHGGAKGVDSFADTWAKKNQIPVEVFPADWERYGKRAGMVRNQEMSNVATHAVFVWDGTSRGTKASIDMAHRSGVMYDVIEWDPPEAPEPDHPTLF